jgi:hypothetical protein
VIAGYARCQWHGIIIRDSRVENVATNGIGGRDTGGGGSYFGLGIQTLGQDETLDTFLCLS